MTTLPADAFLQGKHAGNIYAPGEIKTFATEADAAAFRLANPGAQAVSLEAGTTAATKDAANLAALMAQTTPATFTPPAGFTFPQAVTITRDAAGTYSSNLDVEALHTKGTGATLWVDGTNGSNTNDGLTSDKPVKTPYYAAVKGASEVIVKAGTYLRTDLPWARSGNLTIRAADGARVIFACCDVLADTAWTLEAGTTWKATKASVAGIIDRTFTDADGDPVQLKRATSLATCQTTPATYWTEAGALWVNLKDARKPDANVLVSVAVSAFGIDPAYVTGASSHLMVGIEWWGGNGVNATAPAAGSRFLARQCAFKFGAVNGLSAWGQALTVLDRCTASKNHQDGFNYHDANGRPTNAVEINCIGLRNGWDTTGSQNGSTSHDTCRVIRAGGVHRLNQGANVADVNNAQSWNVGVVAGASLDYGQDYYGGAMWLDSCRSSSSLATAADPTAGGSRALRVRNSVLLGTVDPITTTY